MFLADGPWKFLFELKFYPQDPTTLHEEITRFVSSPIAFKNSERMWLTWTIWESFVNSYPQGHNRLLFAPATFLTDFDEVIVSVNYMRIELCHHSNLANWPMQLKCFFNCYVIFPGFDILWNFYNIYGSLKSFRLCVRIWFLANSFGLWEISFG